MSAPPSHEPSAADASWESLDLGVQRHGDPSSVEWHRFQQGPVVVGSHKSCPLRLDDPTVSPWALYVQRLSDRVVVIDLGSLDCGQRTGVLGRSGRRYVDLLPDGVPVQVGQFQIWHSSPSPTDAEPTSISLKDPLPAFPKPIAAWEILNVRGKASSQKSRHLRHELTLIGQGPLCRFRLVHETIAEIHASLVLVHDQLQVNDLCSEHGVYVNGHKVSQATLHDGDELKIGQCRGKIRRLSPSRPPSQITARKLAVPPQPLKASTAEPANESPADGIEVSLSEEGITVRSQPPQPASVDADGIFAVAHYSEDYVLSLLAQFLDMQRSQLDQTQQLMQKMAERLHQAQSATEFAFPELAGHSAASEPTLPETDEFVDCVQSEDQVPSPKATDESHSAAIRGRNTPHAAPPPELHTWLTHQLAGLETSQRNGISRLWQRLTGSQ